MKNKQISFTRSIVFEKPVTVRSINGTSSFNAVLEGKYLLNEGNVTVYFVIKYYDENNNEIHSLSTNVYKSGKYSDKAERVSGSLTINNSIIKEKVTKIVMSNYYVAGGTNNYSYSTFGDPSASLSYDILTFADEVRETILNNKTFQEKVITFNKT